MYEELDGPAVNALRRAILKVKQRWSVIGWVTKSLLSRTPLWHVKRLVPAAFADVNTLLPALSTRGGLWPVLLMCNPQGGLCGSSGDINGLVIMMMKSRSSYRLGYSRLSHDESTVTISAKLTFPSSESVINMYNLF
jgi:hypothetical protein